MGPLLQPGLTRTSVHDYRLGQIIDALFAANLNRVFGAIALHALEVYGIATPWLHQDTTTITYEDARPGLRLVQPMGTARMGGMISNKCSCVSA
jgi:hypothetical protein